MSKAVICVSTNFSLLGYNKTEKRILDILPRELPGISLTEISNRTNISKSTAQRYLKKMLNKPTLYGKKEYTLLCIDSKYVFQRRACTTKGLGRYCNLTDKNKFDEYFNLAVQNLSKTQLLEKEAEEINEHMLLYSANPKFYSEIISNLKLLYNDAIYDIATGERGIYIIIRAADTTHNDMTNQIKSSLKALYIKGLEKAGSFANIASKSKK